MPTSTLVEIPEAVQAQMRAALRRARYGYLLARHIVLLCAAGRTPTASAAGLFCSRSSVYRTVRAYQEGSLGLKYDAHGRLVPPVRTTADAVAYRERVMQALPAGSAFKPLLTCYLTDETDPDDVERGFRDGVFTGVKLYPANATTNSAAGVTDYGKIRPVLARMEKIGMPFLMHGGRRILSRPRASVRTTSRSWLCLSSPQLPDVPP